MVKVCGACEVEFEAQRKTAKYCSPRCRVRAHQRAKSQPRSPVNRQAKPQMGPVDPDAELWTATLNELTAAGRVESAAGQAALILARRVDDGRNEPGSGLAALVKQHSVSLMEALKGGTSAVNPLDELRSRRDRKRSAG